jgi:hypothetical protein
MPKKRIVLVFEFEEEVYEDEDWSDLNLTKIKLDKERTTLSDGERDSVAERWGQSDEWHVDIHNDILDVIDTGRSVKYD